MSFMTKAYCAAMWSRLRISVLANLRRPIARRPSLGKHGERVQDSQMHTSPLLLAAALLAAPALAADDAADLRAAAAAFDQAQVRGDRTALEAMIAPEFLFVRGSGRVGGKQDFIDGFTAPGVKLEPLVVHDPLLLRVQSDVAVIGGEAWLKGNANGQPFTEHFRFSDMFARRDGHWLVVYSQVTGLPRQ
ncbi:nuclear transport factor 2 family protein [Sphingomonas nostoxanthinifaciens]|uniref:nuclear transport factor 2 family protein n=1 Tax=Sphingomonas nostoxanthinifaciens TaxID=2872652 RepID=UPI001CC1CD44|nr:nuclear transport factor 2 family protein [Sphingomonas nostoxanthinifaciens]UAK22892.1 nuclear transport factor 2 family protein [Sphingomonas nostoxanthinifaciens]